MRVRLYGRLELGVFRKNRTQARLRGHLATRSLRRFGGPDSVFFVFQFRLFVFLTSEGMRSVGWQVHLLPFVAQGAIYDGLDFGNPRIE